MKNTLAPRAFKVEYDSNNSGGGWWLKDADWQKLEASGWFVEWGGLDFCNERYPSFGRKTPSVAPNTHETNECPGHRRFETYEAAVASGERWLGALATRAWIAVDAYSSKLAEGIAAEWWRETLDMDPNEPGCSCCGQPHNFWAQEPKP